MEVCALHAGQSGSRTALSCYYCQKSGHLKRECRAYKRDQEKEEGTKQPTNQGLGGRTSSSRTRYLGARPRTVNSIPQNLPEDEEIEEEGSSEEEENQDFHQEAAPQ